MRREKKKNVQELNHLSAGSSSHLPEAEIRRLETFFPVGRSITCSADSAPLDTLHNTRKNGVFLVVTLRNNKWTLERFHFQAERVDCLRSLKESEALWIPIEIINLFIIYHDPEPYWVPSNFIRLKMGGYEGSHPGILTHFKA